MSADVAVLIVSYNTAQLLRECLESIFAQNSELAQQVIVIDNHSADGSVAVVRENFPQVKLIALKDNLGFARGVNLAAAHADAELYLLLNPDTVVFDNAIERLVSFARRHPGHGLYGGRTIRRDGTLERSSCWDLPTAWSAICFGFGLATLFPRSRLFNPEAMPDWDRSTVREVGIITGCFLLAPREAWRVLGGFDERYFMYGEDADLAFRARAVGFSPIVCPDACIVHEVGKASATRVQKLLLLYRGKATFIKDHFSGWRRHIALNALLGGVALRAVAARLGARSKRPEATAWLTVWRQRETWIRGYA